MNHKCEFCGNLFTSNPNLITHKKTAKYCLAIRDIKTETCECANCGKIFNALHNLKRHQKSCNYHLPPAIQKLLDDKDLELDEKSAEIEKIKKETEEVREEVEKEIEIIKEEVEKEIEIINEEVEKGREVAAKKIESLKTKIKILKAENAKLKVENAKLASDVKADIYHTEYLAIRDKPTTATTTYNNSTTNKLKLVKTDTIDPFTIETIRARLANNEYNYDAYMSGLTGVKRFVMNLITKNDEKNYVTTDISRENFHRWAGTKTWTGDKGALFLNTLFDEMKPKVQEHWEKFKLEMDKEKTLSECEFMDGELERIKPQTVAILAQPDAKPRLELLDDIIKHIKPRVAI